MPRSATGRWVSRAAATGGGRRYRGQRPVNWYVALGLIVVLGLVSVVFSRYEYQHHHTPAATQPAVGTTLFAAYSVDVCGKALAPFTGFSPTAVGISTPGQGVINVSPKTAAEAGNNATFAQFFADYPSAALTSTTLQVPSPKKRYTVGQPCPSGTPDAGKKGVLKVEVWPNAVSKHGTFMTQMPPGNFKIESRTLITVGFVPSGTKQLPRPSQPAINLMLQYAGTVSGGTTTTSTPATIPSPTTAPGTPTTPTTAPSGTTTPTG